MFFFLAPFRTEHVRMYGFGYISGVPPQPSNFRATDIAETDVLLQWSKPSHSSENILQYELYWNDTYANEAHHK